MLLEIKIAACIKSTDDHRTDIVSRGDDPISQHPGRLKLLRTRSTLSLTTQPLA